MGGKGKGKKRKQRAGKGKGKGGDVDNEAAGDERKEKRARNDIWRETGEWDLKNDNYEAYYQRQGICPAGEWDKLVQALRTGLPVAIRVNRTRIGCSGLCERLREMHAACSADQDREQFAPVQLSWYPHSLAWHWPGLERRTVKKDKRNVQLKKYLMHRENSGLISRQEAVSQIPPLCLGIEPHHAVLDLCAAPGSKTSQMIELMHWPQKDVAGQAAPSGLVMANELQWKRANMLAHQVQRLGSQCTMVVNADAQFFPELFVKEGGSDVQIKFDRILADVPCSGDGTMRKTPYIWKSWTLRDGLSLHPYQLGILNRGLDLLKVGGRLVYSTCSLNPVEDEAVVAAALARHGDAVALVPLPELVGLQAAPGLQKWVIQDPNGGPFFESWEEVPKELRECKSKIMPSMFPLVGDAAIGVLSSLQHCRRLLPHLMDTGGFFVAVLEKRTELKPSCKARREARNEQIKAERSQRDGAAAAAAADAPEVEGGGGGSAAPAAAAGAIEPAAPSGPSKSLRRITKEYVQVAERAGLWEEVQSFYGFEPSAASRFVLRTEGNKERLFLLSEGVARLLRSETRLPTRVVLCGVLALEKAMSSHVEACEWRLLQPGAAALHALGLKRRILASKDFMMRLLRERDIELDAVLQAAAEGQVKGLEALERATGEGGLRPGGVIVTWEGGQPGEGSLAVAAEVSDDTLEICVGTSADAAALLEELHGQPPMEEILRAPAASAGEEDGDEPAAVDDEAPNAAARE